MALFNGVIVGVKEAVVLLGFQIYIDGAGSWCGKVLFYSREASCGSSFFFSSWSIYWKARVSALLFTRMVPHLSAYTVAHPSCSSSVMLCRRCDDLHYLIFFFRIFYIFIKPSMRNLKISFCVVTTWGETLPLQSGTQKLPRQCYCSSLKRWWNQPFFP